MSRLIAVPAFEDNYFWLVAESDGRCIIVDPGAAKPVIDALRSHGLQPSAILITHHHADHTGGIEELQDAFALPCFAPNDARIPGRLQRVTEGEQVRPPGSNATFEVIATPGHTRSHVSYLGDGRLFCGDTLFSLGCGRLFEGSPAQMLKSLDCLAALPDLTEVCCAHEYTAANGAFALAVDPDNDALRARAKQVGQLRRRSESTLPSSIGAERACNPFLRVRDSAVVEAVLRHDQATVASDAVDVFAALRRWKDGFQT